MNYSFIPKSIKFLSLALCVGILTFVACQKENSKNLEISKIEIPPKLSELELARYEDFTYKHFKYFSGDNLELNIPEPIREKFLLKYRETKKQITNLTLEESIDKMANEKLISPNLASEFKSIMHDIEGSNLSTYDDVIGYFQEGKNKFRNSLEIEESKSFQIVFAQMVGFMKYAKEVDKFHLESAPNQLAKRCDKRLLFACVGGNLLIGAGLGFAAAGPVGLGIGGVLGIIDGLVSCRCEDDDDCENPTIYFTDLNCTTKEATVNVSAASFQRKWKPLAYGTYLNGLPSNNDLSARVRQNGRDAILFFDPDPICVDGTTPFINSRTTPIDVVALAGDPGIVNISGSTQVSPNSTSTYFFSAKAGSTIQISSSGTILSQSNSVVTIQWQSGGTGIISIQATDQCSGLSAGSLLFVRIN